ncbi:uncharacterized protein LOC131943382 [Physella acuta]|uniref:uncharacterized protein LOC131943382 n=1 Tax=Physella acuta TaxID=109671 RepID=UPI0027DC37D6|nr:uncharacterized protein LOC131943382 [Physella acuta]
MANSEDTLTFLTRRLDQLEAKISAVSNTEEEILEMKQWRENFESDCSLKIENLSKKQKQNFKNLAKQIIEQENSVVNIVKEFERLKDKESNSNKQLQKLSFDVKENEKTIVKIEKDIQANADEIKSMSREMKVHSGIIASLQENEKKNNDASHKALENTVLKYGVMCRVLQQRLAPIEKLMQNINKNRSNLEQNVQMVGTTSNENALLLDFSRVWQHQIKKCKLGFTATKEDHVPNEDFCFKNLDCSIENLLEKQENGSIKFKIPVDVAFSVQRKPVPLQNHGLFG